MFRGITPTILASLSRRATSKAIKARSVNWSITAPQSGPEQAAQAALMNRKSGPIAGMPTTSKPLPKPCFRRLSEPLRRVSRGFAFLDSPDLHIGNGNQAGLHHSFENGRQAIDVFSGIHNGDDGGQVVFQQVGAMDLRHASIAF